MAIYYSLDMRCQNILNMILNTQGYLRIADIATENHVSLRSIYYDIAKINEWLKAFDIDDIIIERQKGVTISSDHAKKVRQALKQSSRDIDYLFTPTQRVQIMICTMIIRTKQIYIEDFVCLCHVSRNTVIADLKVVSHELSRYQLSLHYENGIGYSIRGMFLNKTSLFFRFFHEVSDYYRKGILELDNKELIYGIDEKLNVIEKALHTKYVSGVLFTLSTFCAAMISRKEVFVFDILDKNEIKETDEFALIQMHFHELDESYQVYMALYLLGSRLQTVPIHLQIDNHDQTYEISKKLVEEFSNVACIQFQNVNDVVMALFAHLKTSFYRYKYGVQLVNPMLEKIKQEYRELFELTKKASIILQEELGMPIPDSEIAYLTLHFGSFIVDSQDHCSELRILIICPNGVSTGHMLKAEIHAMVPQTTVIDNIMLSEFEKHHEYDVIISTVAIAEDEDVLIVHPILTDSDRIMILRKCIAYTKVRRTEVEDIVDLAKDYMDANTLNEYRRKLQNYFVAYAHPQTALKRHFGLGMLNHLSESHIMVCPTYYNWQEAILFASVPLLDRCCIEERYVENIVKKCHEMGPYMFIADSVVLAHAGINDGVNSLGISMATFVHPVRFSSDKKAHIILVLATTDQVSHIRILDDIMTIFSCQKNIQDLIQLNQPQDVLTLIDTLLRTKI